jgi:hypothetical protein
MLDAERSRIELVLEGTAGDRKAAARILEMTPKQLANIIRNNAPLREKWVKKNTPRGSHLVTAPTEAPTELETMRLGAPDPELPPVTPVEQALARVVDDSDCAMRGDLESLGLTPEQSDEAMSYVRYHAKHSAKSVDLFGAMIVKRGLRLVEITQQLEEDIKAKNFRDIRSPDGAFVIRSGEESKFELYDRCLSQLRKLTELTHTGALARAKIRMWDKAGSTNPNGKNRKPGFSPLQRPNLVNVQPGGTVHINAPPETPTPTNDK